MSEKINVASGPNDVSFTYDEDPHRDDPAFTIRVRTAKNAHINAPVSLADIRALHTWLTKHIAEADKPKGEVPENQLDMFPI
jgi:hypothetical protein